ncbi:MAG TPA: class I SAM-dependent methyltransferase [Lacipirellulaceae bacterium]|jgi:SAM-dependent methyltransferase
MNRSDIGDNPMDRRTAYQPTSSQEQFIVPLLRASIEAALREFAAPLGPGKKLLDVGCGEQPLRSILREMGFDYVGADVQQNRSATVDFVTAIDQPLPPQLPARGPYDFIVCTEVLEHVADWDTAFRNLRSLLAPGGRMLVTCPQFYPLHEIPHDFWRPTPYALQFFAARQGLRILNQQSAGDGLEVLGTALACVQPVSRSGGIFSRVVAFACDVSRKAAFVLLRSRLLRQYVKGQGVLYLSNIVVLECPASN